MTLVHTTVSDPGYLRRSRGKGFEYFKNNTKLTSAEILLRINTLAIPPAWKDVWICANLDGHLQATGIDARKRKQYLYHAEWNVQSNTSKFDRMAAFVRVLPSLRKRMQNDLRKNAWPQEKVIALIVSLLDMFSLRIGNKVYEQANETYGVTTLKDKHLKTEGNQLILHYRAKGGKCHKVPIHSKKMARLLRECSDLPGQELFQYIDEEGNQKPIFSNDVNAYIREMTEGYYTAKDFRTWGGTVRAITLFPEAQAEIAENPRRTLLTTLVKKVAEQLGNTIAICKAYYIHPAVLSMTGQKDIDFDKLHLKAEKKYVDLKDDLSRDEIISLYVIENGV